MSDFNDEPRPLRPEPVVPEQTYEAADLEYLATMMRRGRYGGSEVTASRMTLLLPYIRQLRLADNRGKAA